MTQQPVQTDHFVQASQIILVWRYIAVCTRMPPFDTKRFK